MRNKLIVSLFIFIACAIVAILIFYKGNCLCSSYTKGMNDVKFQEIEASNDTSYYTGADISNCPYLPQRYEKGIIPDASSAAKIAYNYVTFVFGEECAKTEQPYQIQLVNGQIWFIDGYLPENYCGGTFSIAIEKYTGKIWCISHGK